MKSCQGPFFGVERTPYIGVCTILYSCQSIGGECSSESSSDDWRGCSTSVAGWTDGISMNLPLCLTMCTCSSSSRHAYLCRRQCNISKAAPRRSYARNIRSWRSFSGETAYGQMAILSKQSDERVKRICADILGSNGQRRGTQAAGFSPRRLTFLLRSAIIPRGWVRVCLCIKTVKEFPHNLFG